MITLYTGSVGSGKSFHSTHLGLEWASRKNVIANFPIKANRTKRQQRQLAAWDFNEDITIPYLVAKSIENGWYGKESQCLVIIDEAGIIFNSRDWQTAGEGRKQWIKFMSQSRKFGYDFIFVAQSDRMIDKQIRGLVEFEVKHLKANNSFFLAWTNYLPKFMRPTLFLYVYRWYQTRLKSNLRTGFYRHSIGSRYDTFRTFNLDELVEYLEKMYEGTLIPASVATFIDAQRSIIDGKLKEKKAGVLSDREGLGAPSDREATA